MFRTGSSLINAVLESVQRQALPLHDDRVSAARQYLDSCSSQEVARAVSELQAAQFQTFDRDFMSAPHSTFGFTIRAALAQWVASTVDHAA